MKTEDRWNLARFISAQDPVYARVCAELQRSRKESHWMWFIFPQFAGFGSSPTSRHFAISGRAEAEAYLQHPLLGARLLECTGLVNAIEDRTVEAIFGFPDDRKFHSCMTLFASIDISPEVFVLALEKYFTGSKDQATLASLA